MPPYLQLAVCTASCTYVQGNPNKNKTKWSIFDHFIFWHSELHKRKHFLNRKHFFLGNLSTISESSYTKRVHKYPKRKKRCKRMKWILHKSQQVRNRLYLSTIGEWSHATRVPIECACFLECFYVPQAHLRMFDWRGGGGDCQVAALFFFFFSLSIFLIISIFLWVSLFPLSLFPPLYFFLPLSLSLARRRSLSDFLALSPCIHIYAYICKNR